MPKKNKKKTRRTSIGGQAVLEGVMMRGHSAVATCVRRENGEIETESFQIKPPGIINKIPILRGVVNFFKMLVFGTKITLRSSEAYIGEEQEPSKADKFLAKYFKSSSLNIAIAIGLILGIALSVALFILLPQFLVSLITKYSNANLSSFINHLIEGSFRLTIFIGYIFLISLVPDIKRLFMYHGAEHKTISCYEHGLELTVENTRKMSTVHDRCGTTFMFIVMVISIFITSLTGWQDKMIYRILIRLALVPVVAGVSYEILKFFALFDNWFFTILKSPGLLLQKLTTKEPTDDMIEVAIKAFNAVLDLESGKEEPQDFNLNILFEKVKSNCRDKVKNLKEFENSNLDWIYCEILMIKRSEIDSLIHITNAQAKKIYDAVDQLAQGKSVDNIFNKTRFYNIDLYTDEQVLTPRQETEELLVQVLMYLKDMENINLLDICTGSGCLAISIKKELKDARVTASDISQDALEITKKNAISNDVEIKIVESNMFDAIDDEYTILVSNPPYIKTAELSKLDDIVVNNDPLIALDGGVDGLDYYKIIADNLNTKMSKIEICYLEIGYDQADDIKKIFKDFAVEIKKDINKNDRIAIIKRIKDVK